MPAAGFEARIVQTAREATTQIGLVAAGLGLALLPAPLERVQIPRVRYLPVSDAGWKSPWPLQSWTRRQAPCWWVSWRCSIRSALADAHAHERTIHQAVSSSDAPITPLKTRHRVVG